MIDLRLLGPPRISASDGRVQALVRQPRRLALLAYLAAAVPGGAHRRDRLLALFWPESDAGHARASLSQALYVLRSALGEDALISRGADEVELDPAKVRCDVPRFEAALDQGRVEEAMDLYRGDLLDGFFIRHAPEFEQWLDARRARLRQRAAEGAWQLAASLVGRGDALAAADWARRAADLLPGDEAVVRRLMAFLHGLGDRAAALRAYDAFAVRLAAELDLPPSPATARLAETIREEDASAPSAPRLPEPGPDPEPASSPRPVPVGAAPARGAAAVEAGGAVPGRRQSGVVVLAVVLAGLGVPVLASLKWPGPAAARRPPVTRFVLEFDRVPPLASGIGGATIALAPDGSALVYLGDAEGGERLHVRPMDRLEAEPVPHTRGARVPFFSPDGEWLGFVDGDRIRKVRLQGGPPITVVTGTGDVSGASWGADGAIVYATAAGLWRVASEGAGPMLVAPADTVRGERFRWPWVLPGGGAAVFTRVDDTGFHLAAVSLASGEVRDLGVAGTSPRFVASGHLVYAASDGVVRAVRFDRHRLRVAGSPSVIAEGVLVGIAGDAKMGTSGDGALAWVPGGENRELVLVDRDGTARAIPLAPQGFSSPRFSPDGRTVVVGIDRLGGGRQDLWILDLGSGEVQRITSTRNAVAPMWTPDGRRIVFAAWHAGPNEGWALRWMAAAAGDPGEPLLAGAKGQLPAGLTPDGATLVFQRLRPETRRDLWLLPLAAGSRPEPYLEGPADERAAALSPDGRWLAYASDESGRDEVYVRSFPKPGAAVRVSAAGGGAPRWSGTGGELFYRGPDGLMAVAIGFDPDPRPGHPRLLFDDGPYHPDGHTASYDVSPDGTRFVMVRRGTGDRQVVVVLNRFPLP